MRYLQGYKQKVAMKTGAQEGAVFSCVFLGLKQAFIEE